MYIFLVCGFEKSSLVQNIVFITIDRGKSFIGLIHVGKGFYHPSLYLVLPVRV